MLRLHSLFIRLKTSRFQKFLVPKGPKGHLGQNLPRTVWMFWAQGLDQAPPIVRFCVASWEQQNPSWSIRVLDINSAGQVVDLSDLSTDIPLETLSDLLRLRLLKTHGGVWADATLYCQAPLDHWVHLVLPSGTFFFQKPKPERIMANWFMAAHPGTALLREFENCATAYWAGRTRTNVYFWFHFTVEYLIRTRCNLRREFEQMPKLSAEPCLRLQRHLRGKTAGNKTPDLVGVPMHKLSWKTEIDPEQVLQAIADDPPSGNQGEQRAPMQPAGKPTQGKPQG